MGGRAAGGRAGAIWGEKRGDAPAAERCGSLKARPLRCSRRLILLYRLLVVPKLALALGARPAAALDEATRRTLPRGVTACCCSCTR